MADDKPKMQRIEGHKEERFLGSDVFSSDSRNLPPPNGTGTVREDARDMGAALAADQGIQPREVDVDAIRKVLREQGAHRHDDAAVKAVRELAHVPAQ